MAHVCLQTIVAALLIGLDATANLVRGCIMLSLYKLNIEHTEEFLVFLCVLVCIS
jgi:hypothetical protein